MTTFGNVFTQWCEENDYTAGEGVQKIQAMTENNEQLPENLSEYLESPSLVTSVVREIGGAEYIINEVPPVTSYALPLEDATHIEPSDNGGHVQAGSEASIDRERLRYAIEGTNIHDIAYAQPEHPMKKMFPWTYSIYHYLSTEGRAERRERKKAKEVERGYEWAAYQLLSGRMTEDDVRSYTHGQSSGFDTGAIRASIDWGNLIDDSIQEQSTPVRDVEADLGELETRLLQYTQKKPEENKPRKRKIKIRR